MKVILLVLLGIMLLHTYDVSACSCVQPGTSQEEMDRSTAVFTGKVMESPHAYAGGTEYAQVTLQVSKVWKGDLAETVSVRTSKSSASCGYNFIEGDEYLVYAGGDEQLVVSLCSRTTLLSKAQEDIDELGQGYPPLNDAWEASKPNPFIILVVLSALAVLIVLLAHRYRR